MSPVCEEAPREPLSPVLGAAVNEASQLPPPPLALPAVRIEGDPTPMRLRGCRRRARAGKCVARRMGLAHPDDLPDAGWSLVGRSLTASRRCPKGQRSLVAEEPPMTTSSSTATTPLEGSEGAGWRSDSPESDKYAAAAAAAAEGSAAVGGKLLVDERAGGRGERGGGEATAAATAAPSDAAAAAAAAASADAPADAARHGASPLLSTSPPLGAAEAEDG